MKINTKLMLAFLPISLALLAAASITSYLNAEKMLTREVLNKLESVASIQRQRIESIVNQNLERLVLVSSRTQLRLSLERYIEDPKSLHQGKMNRILRDARTSIADFEEISILTIDGKIVASTDMEKIGTKHSNEKFFIRGQKENSADIFFLDENQNLRIYLSGPLYLKNKLLGVIIIKSDVDNIVSLVKDYSGLGKTGEMVLVERAENGDALFFTPLRFDQHAALRRTVPKDDLAAPTTQALLNNQQLFTSTVDYRGETVLAATRYIENTDWGLVAKIDKAEAYSSIFRLQYLLVVIILAASILVILISIYISRIITTPIIKLTHVARKISEGDLSHRADVTSRDETGLLAQVFNQMTERLANANTALQQKIEDSKNEIADRRQAEEAIQQLNEELEQRVEERTQKLKDAEEQLVRKEKLAVLGQLAGSVGHEIRNPLGVIGNSVYFLKMKLKDADEKVLKHLNILQKEVQRSNIIITDLLDFSKVRPPSLNEADVNSIVKDTLTYIEISENITIETKLNKNLPKIPLDTKQIHQVFQNLISNAVQAMPEGGRLTIKTLAKGDFVEIIFRDTGVGISKETLPKIFEPLFTTKVKGIGLGLAIIKGIVDGHKGSIEVDSAVGEGTTFNVKLPRGLTIDD